MRFLKQPAAPSKSWALKKAHVIGLAVATATAIRLAGFSMTRGTSPRSLLISANEGSYFQEPARYGWVQKRATPPMNSSKIWDCVSYVNINYRYIFVKQYKTGSTTVRQLFTECDNLAGDSPWCMSPLRPVSRGVIQNWSEYTVFTTVRNPYSRAISNYNYLVGKMSSEPQCSETDFSLFCSNPLSLSQVTLAHPECAITRPPAIIAAHVTPQSRCLVDDQGEWTVDYIARMESLETDLPLIVSKINSRRNFSLPAIFLRPMEVRNPTDVCSDASRPQRKYRVNGTEHPFQTPRERYCNASEYYGHRHAHCKGAIEQRYKDDFGLLY